jgi:DNA-binding XRE family transcriptional regulator
MEIDGEHLADDLVLTRLTAARRIARDGTGRNVRKASGASLAEIGRAVGVSKASICKWERGQLSPSGEHAVRYWLVITTLATTLGLNSD